jgi:CDP-diacylglycerol--serine O-phosphatidyltransferase
MARHFSMIRSFHVSDVVTLANGGCGAWAIFLAMAYVGGAGISTIYVACGVLVAALIFDTLDGRIARWRHEASILGRELDSLADVVSFGAAPAALAYAVGLRTALDQLCLVYFVACGISRLARYNVTAEQLSASTGKVTLFEGTPITSSLLLVFLLTALAAAGRTGATLAGGAVEVGHLGLHWLALLFLLSGSLMISKTLRIPKP